MSTSTQKEPWMQRAARVVIAAVLGIAGLVLVVTWVLPRTDMAGLSWSASLAGPFAATFALWFAIAVALGWFYPASGWRCGLWLAIPSLFVLVPLLLLDMGNEQGNMSGVSFVAELLCGCVGGLVGARWRQSRSRDARQIARTVVPEQPADAAVSIPTRTEPRTRTTEQVVIAVVIGIALPLASGWLLAESDSSVVLQLEYAITFALWFAAAVMLGWFYPTGGWRWGLRIALPTLVIFLPAAVSAPDSETVSNSGLIVVCLAFGCVGGAIGARWKRSRPVRAS